MVINRLSLLISKQRTCWSVITEQLWLKKMWSRRERESECSDKNHYSLQHHCLFGGTQTNPLSSTRQTREKSHLYARSKVISELFANNWLHRWRDTSVKPAILRYKITTDRCHFPRVNSFIFEQEKTWLWWFPFFVRSTDQNGANKKIGPIVLA